MVRVRVRVDNGILVLAIPSGYHDIWVLQKLYVQRVGKLASQSVCMCALQCKAIMQFALKSVNRKLLC